MNWKLCIWRYISPKCWSSETNHFISLSFFLFLVFLLSYIYLHYLLILVFFDLLQGSHQSFGCGVIAQPLGCCRSNGRCSFLKSTGSPCSSTCASPAPSPTARSTSQPCHPKTRPRAHPHHPRANPVLPLLTYQLLTSSGQEQPLQKHTVKIQTWSTKQQLIGENPTI